MLLSFDHSTKVEIYVTANKEGWISYDTGSHSTNSAMLTNTIQGRGKKGWRREQKEPRERMLEESFVL